MTADDNAQRPKRVIVLSVPGSDEISGKFGAMLTDIFGRSFPQGALFPVDREAVRRYKVKVTDNCAALRDELADLLKDQ